MSRTLLLFVGICLALAAGERVRYDNYQVFRVSASDENQLKVLQDLESTSDSVIFLEAPFFLSKTLDVVVAPHKVPDFVGILVTTGITHELYNKNAQSLLDEEDIGRSSRGVYDWTSYQTLADTNRWLKTMATAFPRKVSIIVGGSTHEGREILGIKISYKTGNSGVFVEGGIHGREWISPATVTYLINELLTSTSPSIRDIAENNDWYIFPHVNPDGYDYSWTKDRMWRKTRKPYGSCYGADANRNFNFYWNTAGSSDNPCSENYAGSSADSEIEIKSLSNYILSLKGKIHLYLSFHAYSQFLLYPYGHSYQQPTNIYDIRRISNATLTAINKRYGTMYYAGSMYSGFYPASGTSIDWAYTYAGTKLAYCYLLRPSGNDNALGFQLPASQIIATASETIDSIVAMIGMAKQLYYL